MGQALAQKRRTGNVHQIAGLAYSKAQLYSGNHWPVRLSNEVAGLYRRCFDRPLCGLVAVWLKQHLPEIYPRFTGDLLENY